MKQLQLFPLPPARPKQVRMHILDAGDEVASFKCRKCDHKTGWIKASISDMRRGIPCPTCNPPHTPTTTA